MRAREKSEDSGPERTCIVTGLAGRAGGDVALRAVRRGRGDARYPGQAARPRRLDAARQRRGAPGGAEQAFARGFRKPVRVGPEVAEDVDRLLEQDSLRFLSLVNKAGLVITGAAKVEAAIRAGRLAGLIHASDGSADGSGKLDRLLLGLLGEKAESAARINLFTSSQLDLALGRTNVIHAALCAGPASSAFLAKVARLTRYRSGERASTSASAAVGAAVAG